MINVSAAPLSLIYQKCERCSAHRSQLKIRAPLINALLFNHNIFNHRYDRGDESFGILEQDFATVRDEWKLRDLQEIMP